NPPGQWQLQVQVFHWRGEVWRAGQNSDAVVAAAATALRACQQTVPSVSPSITLEQTGRVAAVISVGGALPQVAHEYLVSHPLSGTLVELAMWATSPPLVGWPTVADEKILDALTAPLCAAYTGSCS
ncbi:MAG: ATPase, partial [Mycobacteriaceae bacterium]|nr:ATPase [Mycobacteriaceae bacterium]